MNAKTPVVYYDEDGWYFRDYEDEEHGPYHNEQEAQTAYGHYVAKHGNCPTCRGD